MVEKLVSRKLGAGLGGVSFLTLYDGLTDLQTICVTAVIVSYIVIQGFVDAFNPGKVDTP